MRLAIVIGSSLLALSACALDCNRSTCAEGCCSADGKCMVVGVDSLYVNQFCGLGGAACEACADTERCSTSNTSCVTSCGADTCAGGCCRGGVCYGGSASDACGKGGAACTTCPSTENCVANVCTTCKAKGVACRVNGDCCSKLATSVGGCTCQ